MANHRHLKLINSGVPIWNSWRNKNPTLKPNLSGADLSNRDLSRVEFTGVDLMEANLSRTNLFDADLTNANLSGADIRQSSLVHTTLNGANMTGCKIYGISAWSVLTNDNTIQKDLLINQNGEPKLTVDNLKVAQFVYLLLKNKEIGEVINTVGNKGVLILGRFAIAERMNVLDAMRTALRNSNYLPIVFDFEKPTDRDFTETIMTLAGMCKFIIADITNPKSSPLELQALVPNYMIPLVTIIQSDEKPFSMFKDLWLKHPDWVLTPLEYDTLESLIGGFNKGVLKRAEEKHMDLRAKKAQEIQTLNMDEFQ